MKNRKVASSGEPPLSVWFSNRSTPVQLFIAALLLSGIGVLDYLTGSELAFAIFYLAPITLASWYVGRGPGILFSLLGAFLWWGAEMLDGRVYSHSHVIYWNTAVRLGFFLIFNHLVSVIRRELINLTRLSQRDHLTGAVNRRYFAELAEVEIARTARNGKALSLAYIDLDNFKTVNDSLGHETGDEILTRVVQMLKDNLRRPDVVARVGGDEFLILMPETDLPQAQMVMERQLERCGEMIRQNGWPIGLSIGLVSSSQCCELDRLIKLADEQMYIAKQSGKNKVCFTSMEAEPKASQALS